MITTSKKVIKDVMTGPDGQTYAAGRVLSAPVALFALGSAGYGLAGSPTPEMFTSLAVYVPATIAAVAGLIGLTNHTEPKDV